MISAGGILLYTRVSKASYVGIAGIGDVAA